MFFKNRTEEERALRRRINAKQLEIVGEMNRAGVRILTGTDVAMSGFDALRAITVSPPNPALSQRSSESPDRR
jgi:hypothetical protein